MKSPTGMATGLVGGASLIEEMERTWDAVARCGGGKPDYILVPARVVVPRTVHCWRGRRFVVAPVIDISEAFRQLIDRSKSKGLLTFIVEPVNG